MRSGGGESAQDCLAGCCRHRGPRAPRWVPWWLFPALRARRIQRWSRSVCRLSCRGCGQAPLVDGSPPATRLGGWGAFPVNGAETRGLLSRHLLAPRPFGSLRGELRCGEALAAAGQGRGRPGRGFFPVSPSPAWLAAWEGLRRGGAPSRPGPFSPGSPSAPLPLGQSQGCGLLGTSRTRRLGRGQSLPSSSSFPPQPQPGRRVVLEQKGDCARSDPTSAATSGGQAQFADCLRFQQSF